MPFESPKAKQKLKEALWYHIGKYVDKETARRGLNATPQYIAALTELVWNQIGKSTPYILHSGAFILTPRAETVAKDLEAFSRHAGRTTITNDDVMLLARRNSDLHRILKEIVDKQEALKAQEDEAEEDEGEGEGEGEEDEGEGEGEDEGEVSVGAPSSTEAEPSSSAPSSASEEEEEEEA
ncbi:hypothetical protein OQA88_6399 [Cercophora sp. LCS_1]